MSEYSFILDEMRYSFSSLSTFANCKHGFRLTYVDAEDRVGNFFSDYGKLIHKTLEKYFREDLSSMELSEFYKSNYDKMVKETAPPFPKGMDEKYREQGQMYFDYFPFDRSNYEILFIEDAIKFDFYGSSFVIKPDLVLKDKNTEKVILIDFKSSSPFFKDKPDKKKFVEYYKQLYLYTYGIRTERKVNVHELMLWFPRIDKTVTIDWNADDELKYVEWAKNIIQEIKKEEKFEYNNSGTYFCNYICSVRNSCEFKEKA